jgi:hypothetical protein
VASLEERVEKLEKMNGAARSVPPAVPAPSRKISAKEFLMTKVVKTELQKVLVFAYYLERQETLTSFNVSDLEGVFRAARERLPKNMNDAVNKNIARGYLMEAVEKKGAKKAWNLTSTGERLVENEMNAGSMAAA